MTVYCYDTSRKLGRSTKRKQCQLTTRYNSNQHHLGSSQSSFSIDVGQSRDCKFYHTVTSKPWASQPTAVTRDIRNPVHCLQVINPTNHHTNQHLTPTKLNIITNSITLKQKNLKKNQDHKTLHPGTPHPHFRTNLNQFLFNQWTEHNKLGNIVSYFAHKK